MCDGKKMNKMDCAGCKDVHLCITEKGKADHLNDFEKLELIKTSPFPEVVAAGLDFRPMCCD